MTELADQQVQESQQLENAVVETHDNTPAEKPLSIRESLESAVKETRARDERGQFTKPQAAPEKVEAPEQAIPEATTEQPEVQASNPVGPPPVWKKELGALWDTLPPAVKAFAVKREENVQKGIDEYRLKTQEIEQVLAPRRAEFQQFGITSDAQAINTLFAWEQSFRNPATRAQAFQNLAQSYGFDLTQIAQAPQAAQGEHEQRPAPDHLTPRLEQLEQRLNTADSQAMQREIQAFANGKPHFEAVRTLMGQLLSGGAAATLDAAYQMALKTHPEVSQLILQEEQAKAEAERKKAAEDKARAAAAAGASVRGNSPRGDVQTRPKPNAKVSVRDSLLEAVKEARA